MLPRPAQPDSHDDDIYEAQIGHNGCDVQEYMLVCLQSFEVKAVKSQCNYLPDSAFTQDNGDFAGSMQIL
jgi:hypothetical protein